MTIRSLVFASIVSLALPAFAEAVDIFGNGNRATSNNQGGYNYIVNNAWAVPFTPGNSSAADRNLMGAWVLVGGNNEIEVTFDLAIFNDAGTNQGPTGSSIASGSLVMPAGSLVGWKFVPFAAPVSLATNGKYYVSVGESTGLGGFIWAIPASTAYSNLGSGSDYALTTGGSQDIWQRTGSSWGNANFSVATAPFGFQLVTVPEPSTIVLGAISIVTLASIARRRRMSR